MPFVNLFLDDELHAALKAKAKSAGMPLYKLIPELCRVYLELGYDPIVEPGTDNVYHLGEEVEVSTPRRSPVIDTTTGEILPEPTKKSSLALLVEERRDIDFGLDFKPVPKPTNGRKRAKTRKNPPDMSDNVG